MLNKYTKLYWAYRKAMHKVATATNDKDLKLAKINLKQATNAFIIYYKGEVN